MPSLTLRSCKDEKLVEIQDPGQAVKLPSGDSDACQPNYLHLSDPPYENYFTSDCSGASQVVVTTPLADSDLKIISPRLLVRLLLSLLFIVTTRL